jgi:hypothetical protein
MPILEQIKTAANTRIWGQHSLTAGSVIGLVIGVAIIYFKFLGSWSLWIGIAVIAIATALF